MRLQVGDALYLGVHSLRFDHGSDELRHALPVHCPKLLYRGGVACSDRVKICSPIIITLLRGEELITSL